MKRNYSLKVAYPSCHCSKSIPMIRLTPEGIITCVNDFFCQVGHFMAKEKLLNHFIGEFTVHPEDAEWFKDALHQLRDREADVVRRECEVFSNSGYPICLDFVLLAKRDMTDVLRYVSCILQDISPTKKNEHRLRKILKEQERLNRILLEAQKEMKESLEHFSIQTEGDSISEMRRKLTDVAEIAELRIRRQTASLASVSHDIRTPLGAIIGFSDLLAEAETAEEKKEYLSIIHNNSQLISNLLKSILDLEMLDSGQFVFREDCVDLKSLGLELCSVYNVISENDEVKVSFDEEKNADILLSTDSNQFRRILNNLIGNAVKNTKQGQVVFSYTKKGEFIEFVVSDTGCGIPKEKLKSIFDRYERVSRSYTGFGLGLAICQSLVDAMGGKIWVTSEEGKGSTFCFTLPDREE